jgi:RNA polymerase sigma-70 factor, ECF subfamily
LRRSATHDEQTFVNAASPLPEPIAEAQGPEHDARLRRVVAAHFDPMWRLLRRLGVPSRDLDDAVQEVIMVLARRLPEVPPASERSFVLGTACRIASTFRRAIRRRREADHEPTDELQDDAESPEALLEQRRARAMLDTVLAKLVPEFRAVFVLYELERFTLAEIADTLGLPQGTVASRLRRGRAQFQDEVKRLERRIAGDEA